MIAPRAHQVKSAAPIDFPFAPIPHEILQRKDVSSLAKLVFAVIANDARMRRDDATPLTNQQIADAVGANVASVRRALDELERAGLVDRRFGASERVRESIRVAFAPTRVAHGRATPPSPVEQPGCASASDGVAHGRATPLKTKNEEREKSPSISTSGGEKTPDPDDRIATPEETAAFMRALIRGAKPVPPEAPPPAPPGPTPAPAAPAARPPDRPQARPTAECVAGSRPPAHDPRPLPASGGYSPPPIPAKGANGVRPPAHNPSLPDLKTMFGRVGFSAVAAIQRGRPPRKTAAQQMAELAEASRRRARSLGESDGVRAHHERASSIRGGSS
jgi:hypothetical protein